MASAFALLLISQFSNAAPTLTFNKLSWSFYLKRILFSWWTIFSSDCNLMAKSFTDSRDSSCARNFTKLFVAEVFSHVKYHIVCFFPSSRYLIFSILDINVKRHHSQPYQNQYRNSQWRQSLKYCPVQFLLLPLLNFGQSLNRQWFIKWQNVIRANVESFQFASLRTRFHSN